MRLFTVGHGTRSVDELVACLDEAAVRTLVDVRRFPSSRRNPQFNRDALGASLAAAGIEYRHAEELGGRRTGEPGEERFDCIRLAAFRSYAARMGDPAWQEALAAALDEPHPCLMCAETPWWRVPPPPDRGAAGGARARGLSPARPRPRRTAPAMGRRGVP
jgi:uncharacterized protein (DUF488 family)